tara:strand:- start:177 stop:620 length:444 start_codon:yes stop_codon:yes gene_type:complete
MKKKDTSKPLMLYLPESIYFQLIKIKESEPQITNIELVERFLATKEFNEIKKGNFHDNLFEKIKENNFINLETGIKIPKETIDLLKFQKNTVMKQFQENSETYFAKSSFPLSNSQNSFGLVWRMCETYELWCKEIENEKLIKLKFIS